MWASIAFARGYLNTRNVKFKIIARANFDRTYARSWDSALGGEACIGRPPTPRKTPA